MDLRVIARTTMANLIRFGSGLIAVIVTPLLLHRFGSERYDVWVLVLQVTTYVALLEIGISEAVVRFVAPHATKDGASDEAHALMRAALVLEFMFIGLATLAAVGVSALVPVLFHKIPHDLVSTARFGFIVVGIAAAFQLSIAPLAGYFNAVQRNLRPSTAVLVVRAGSAAAVVVAANHGLRVAMITTAIGLFVNALVQGLLFRIDLHGFRLFGPVNRDHLREIFAYCTTLMIWTAASFLVGGLDTTVVGVFDFHKVGAYAIAVSATAIVFGIHASAVAAFVPDMSRSFAAGDRDAVTGAVTAAAGYGNLFLFVATAAVITHGKLALELWVGDSVARVAYPVLVMLTVGKSIGSLMSPYVAGLIGTGDHRRVRLTPMVEGLVNIGVSIPLAAAIGANGPAIGTVVGCTVGALLHFVYNVPRTVAFELDRPAYVRNTVLPAAIVAAPLLVAGLLPGAHDAQWRIIAVTAGTIITLVASLGLMRRISRSSHTPAVVPA